MNIIKWEPFDDFEGVFKDFGLRPASSKDMAIDIYEEKNNIVAKMNLPGIDPEKVGISVEDEHLRVSGKKEEKKEEKKSAKDRLKEWCAFPRRYRKAK